MGLPGCDACTGRALSCCATKGSGAADAGFLHAPFELDSTAEGLYLSDRSGRVRDCAFLHDIPYGGSMGRMSGEKRLVFYFLHRPSRGRKNRRLPAHFGSAHMSGQRRRL